MSGQGLAIGPSSLGARAEKGLFLDPKWPGLHAADIVTTYGGLLITESEFQELRRKGTQIEPQHARKHAHTTHTHADTCFCWSGQHTHCVFVMKGVYLDGKGHHAKQLGNRYHLVFSRAVLRLHTPGRGGGLLSHATDVLFVCLRGYLIEGSGAPVTMVGSVGEHPDVLAAIDNALNLILLVPELGNSVHQLIACKLEYHKLTTQYALPAAGGGEAAAITLVAIG